MTAKMALYKLGHDYNLPLVTIEELRLHMAVPGSLGICVTVAKIIETFNSTQENEDAVCDLLRVILGIHFKKRVSR